MRWPVLLIVVMFLSGCTLLPDGEEDDPDEGPDETGVTWSWEPAPGPALARGEAACADDGSRILLAGGVVEPPVDAPMGFEATRSVEVYDVGSSSWSDTPDLPVALHHLAVAYAGQRFWALGGYPGPTFTPTDLVFSWAPGESDWSMEDRMPVARGAHGAGVVGDRIILVGGVTLDGVTARVDAYNTTSGEWARLEDAPTAREHLAVDAHNGTVYVAAGRAGDFDSRITDFDVYMPATGEWEQGPPLPTPRGGSSGAAGPLGFFVAGGEATGRTFEQVERYDPETAAWETLPEDPDPRHGLCVVVLDDRVHVVTGGHEPGFDVSDTHNVLVSRSDPV